ncbi:MAG: spermidine synthase [Terriglobia bacterium]
MAAEAEAPTADDRNASAVAASRVRLALWLVTAALAGAVIMGLELVGFRLFAPYFGYSIYVWGSLISVVMAALAAGYAWGGWLSDRCSSDRALYITIFLSGIYQLVILYTAIRLLESLYNAGQFEGPVIATVVIFGPPMLGLAGTSPFVIRLLARAGHVGSSAGRVYALATVGSIGGVLLTAFLMVPGLGTHATLQILCAISVVLGVAGLPGHRRAILAGGLALLVVALAPVQRLRYYELWRAQSAYNEVRVMDYDGYLMLCLNDLRHSHTTIKMNSRWSGSYQDEYVLGPLLVHAKHLLSLGMGAGGSIRFARLSDPALQVDAVEIDPDVVKAARDFFGLPTYASWLHVHVADARPWLKRSCGRFDLVHVDLYQGGPYIPFYLVTKQFFRMVRARMTPDGLLMMNVYDAGRKRQILESSGATLERVFPTVLVTSRVPKNYMLFAFAKRTTAASVRAELRSYEGDPGIARIAGEAASHMAPLEPPTGTVVFTDDHAPIDPMTRRMMAEDR